MRRATEKVAFLRANAGVISAPQIAKHFGCDVRSLRKLADRYAIDINMPVVRINGICCPQCGRRGLSIATTRNANGTCRRRYEDSQGHRWTTLESVVPQEV